MTLTKEEIRSKADYAMHELVLAKMFNRDRDAEKWQNHLDYWMVELRNWELINS